MAARLGYKPCLSPSLRHLPAIATMHMAPSIQLRTVIRPLQGMRARLRREDGR